MGDDTHRLSVGHMGCYPALAGLGAISDYVVTRRRPALLVCVEVCSLHVQPPGGDLDQVVGHALFSDGAAAAVEVPGDLDALNGWRIVDVAAPTCPAPTT